MTELAVRAEQVRTLYRRGLAAFAANAANSVIIAALLWSEGPRLTLWVWPACMLLISLARLALARSFTRAAPGPPAAARWGRLFAVGSAAAGSAWGVGGFLLLGHGGALAQLILPFAIGGTTAAAAGTLSVYFPAFLAFVLPALLGLLAGALWIGDAAHLAMAAMFVVYGVALYSIALVTQRALLEAFRFRFQNEALLGELSDARTRLEDTNRTLEQRVAERSAALQRQTDALREAQRMESIGRLAGGVAHDFNNLLMVVLGNASDLMADRELEPAMHSRLVEIRDAATRGAELVKQLLLFGRRQDTHLETLELNHAVTLAERLLGRLLGEHLTLKVTLCAEPLFVRADPTQIEQVVINLVTNARDAMTAGGIVSIETKLLALSAPERELDAGEYAVLSVTDTGTGMDSQTRMRMFEPFFTTKEVGQGTGLGLATVYAVVDQCGGHIRVESELARGSSFSVYLPRCAAPVSGEVRPSAAPQIEPQTATVLLVEDDPAVRAVTGRMLRRRGYRVLIARDAQQALALAERHTGLIQLLVSDVVMPGLGGPELGARLRASRPEICMLFMSGYRREHTIPNDEARVAFVAKPFAHDAFLSTVATLLAVSGKRAREG